MSDCPLFHVKFDVVQRSRGGDARKVAAYQRCARMQFRGARFNFTRKRKEHIGHEVILPAGAPAWAADPKELWQRAEDAERRGDAQPARMVEVAIPRGVAPDKRLDFARSIAAPWVADGMAVQLDIHCTQASDGSEQPHAHYELTMRRFEGDDFGKVKPREWSRAFQANRGRDMRATIADRMNTWMAAHGIEARVDHRTYEAQGITGPATERDVSPRAWKAHAADPASAASAPVRQVLAERQQRQAERREITWEAARADYAKAAAEHYAAEKKRRQNDYAKRRQAEQAARGDMRTRQRAERSRVYKHTQRGLVRDLSLALQRGRHERDRTAFDLQIQTDRLTGTAPTGSFPGFDQWIEERAAEGDQTAKAALAQRQSRREWLAKKDPVAAARRHVADAERAADRVLRGRPRASVDEQALFLAARNKFTERRDQAAQAARASRLAVVEHWRSAGFWRRWTDAGWRQEHVQLTGVAVAARQSADRIAGRYDADVRIARTAAQRAATANRHVLAEWLGRADVQAAQAALETVHRVRRAMDSGDQETITTAAAGNLPAAAQAAKLAEERRAAEEHRRAEDARAAGEAERQAVAQRLQEAAQQAAEARRRAAEKEETYENSATVAPGRDPRPKPR